MQAIWKGSISFGLVNIPINLYTGAESPSLHLTMLHKADLSPIRYAKICKEEGKEIPYQEIVKGFEYQKGEYVILNESDFEKASISSSHVIDVIEFVNENEIDIRYYDKPYYLEPGKSADKAYALFREALLRSKKVGIATVVFHNREHIAMIKPIGNVLVLNTMRYAREVRDTNSLKVPQKERLKNQEIDMALTLIKQMTKKFSPKDLRDTYDETLEKIVRAKTSGKKITRKTSLHKRMRTTNLMLALKASLKKSHTRKASRQHPKKRIGRK